MEFTGERAARGGRRDKRMRAKLEKAFTLIARHELSLEQIAEISGLPLEKVQELAISML